MAVAVTKKPKGNASRARILDAAAALFRDQGYAAVSLRAIAAAAGMQSGSVYYHFGSKEEIVTEVLNLGIERVHDQVSTTIATLPVDADAATLIRTGIRNHLTALFAFGAYTSANVRIYGQVPTSARQGNLAVRRRYEGLWDDILSRAQARGGVQGGVDLAAFRLVGTRLRGEARALVLEYEDASSQRALLVRVRARVRVRVRVPRARRCVVVARAPRAGAA